MNSRLLAVLIIFPVWLALVLVFRKHRQWLLYYLVAAFGLTLQLVFIVEYLGWDQILVNVASFHVDMLTKYFLHIPINLLTNGRFQIIMPDSSSSILKLGIECSAVLESSIVLSLIVFYPLFNPGQKLVRVLFCLIVTYVINVFRLIIIVLMAYRFGSDYIFIAHAGVARIFFFICELFLYWFIMTKPSVKAVGASVEGKVPLSQVATVGNAFKLRYAIGQIAIIIIFAILVGGSFVGSNEWRVAIAPAANKARPIIYTDETAMETFINNQQILDAEGRYSSTQTEQIVDDFSLENVLSNEEKTYKYHVVENGSFNVRLVQGNAVHIEIYKNGQLKNKTNINPPNEGLTLDQDVLPELINAVAGDILEIKFKNTGKNKASYVAEIIAGVPNE